MNVPVPWDPSWEWSFSSVSFCNFSKAHDHLTAPLQKHRCCPPRAETPGALPDVVQAREIGTAGHPTTKPGQSRRCLFSLVDFCWRYYSPRNLDLRYCQKKQDGGGNFCFPCFGDDTVDGSEIRRSPVESVRSGHQANQVVKRTGPPKLKLQLLVLFRF